MSSIRAIAMAKAVGGGGGGSSVTVESLTATENKTYTAPSGKAYSPITVNVPNSYAAGDEGKVVDNGALVAQTAHTEITENGTYDTTTNNSVSVNVPTGGGVSLPAKDVNFRDYDGSILAAYTASEFAELSALPSNPDRTSEGLTAQGWNWTLANAKTYVASYGRLEIGQMYITTDGKTHVHIHLEEGRTSPMLGVCPDGTVDVDWGDGTAHDTLTGSSTSTVKWTPTHNYAAPGNYVIKLTVSSGGKMGFYGVGSSNQNSGLLRHSSSANTINYYYWNAILSVRCGNGIDSINAYAFHSCARLNSVTIPNGVTGIGNYAFAYCYALDSITIPSSVTSIGTNVFQTCYGLINCTIPGTVSSIGASAFQNCYSLRMATIPNSLSEFASSVFAHCDTMYRIIIPRSITTIGNSVFQYCYSASIVIIPEDVTSIGNNAFSSCYSVAEYHVQPTTPPTLGTTPFNNIPADCIIYVPAASVEDYKTEWSTYASYIQAEPA